MDPNAPKKDLSELLTDPHFIFTIISLCFSLCIFFFYLYKLLCGGEAWTDIEAPPKTLKKKKKSASTSQEEPERSGKVHEGQQQTTLAELDASAQMLKQLCAEVKSDGQAARKSESDGQAARKSESDAQAPRKSESDFQAARKADEQAASSSMRDGLRKRKPRREGE